MLADGPSTPGEGEQLMLSQQPSPLAGNDRRPQQDEGCFVIEPGFLAVDIKKSMTAMLSTKELVYEPRDYSFGIIQVFHFTYMQDGPEKVEVTSKTLHNGLT